MTPSSLDLDMHGSVAGLCSAPSALVRLAKGRTMCMREDHVHAALTLTAAIAPAALCGSLEVKKRLNGPARKCGVTHWRCMGLCSQQYAGGKGRGSATAGGLGAADWAGGRWAAAAAAGGKKSINLRARCTSKRPSPPCMKREKEMPCRRALASTRAHGVDASMRVSGVPIS